ncbi:hypothetical protein [Mesorhizobium sp. M0898]|uniref:hypothetical protein n=1 Tax=Mesorhizobium sp. M0898 TaxID=2957020 RepID=UPI003335725F
MSTACLPCGFSRGGIRLWGHAKAGIIFPPSTAYSGKIPSFARHGGHLLLRPQGCKWGMSLNDNHQLSSELLTLLGDDDFLRLVEEYGGCRLFVPSGSRATMLADEIGVRAVALLAERYAGAYLRVPLAREFCAKVYRAQGLSNRKVARKLGITETGVDKLFLRLKVASRRSGRRAAANDDTGPSRQAANDDRPKRRLIRAAGDE